MPDSNDNPDASEKSPLVLSEPNYLDEAQPLWGKAKGAAAAAKGYGSAEPTSSSDHHSFFELNRCGKMLNCWDNFGLFSSTSRTGRLISLACGIVALSLASTSAVAFSTTGSQVNTVNWMSYRIHQTRVPDTSTVHLGLARLVLERDDGSYNTSRYSARGDKWHRGMFSPYVPSPAALQICTDAGGQGNVTKVLCNECHKTLTSLRLSQMTGLWGQTTGVIMAIERLNPRFNGFLLHLIASCANMVGILGGLVTIAKFHSGCWQPMQGPFSDHDLTRGPAFVCACVGVTVNLIQWAFHLMSQHDKRLPFTAGTPLKLFCYEEKSCCHKRSRRWADAEAGKSKNWVQQTKAIRHGAGADASETPEISIGLKVLGQMEHLYDEKHKQHLHDGDADHPDGATVDSQPTAPADDAEQPLPNAGAGANAV